MARQRTMEETAQRREAQRSARQAASKSRPPAPASYFAQRMRGLVPLSSPHQGSKRGFGHRPSPAADIARSKARTWSAVTGRPIPPAARIRTDHVSNAVPRPVAGRNAKRGAQRRRDRHKVGHQLAALRPGSKAHERMASAYLALRPDGTAAG